MKITTKYLKDMTRPGIYRVADTLYLRVQCSGPRARKSWIQRLQVDGIRSDLGLGSFPLVSISAAKDSARKNLVATTEGRNPIEEARARRREKAERVRRNRTSQHAITSEHPAFLEVNRAVLRSRRESAKAEREWQNMMKGYVLPHIGHMAIDEIDTPDLVHWLVPLFESKHSTAVKVRTRIRQVFDWAACYGYLPKEHRNPAGRALNAVIPRKKPNSTKHHEALPYRQVAGALAEVDRSKASESARLAIRFITLTACRTKEARLATWDQIDGDMWTAPAEHMKSGKEHRVPLSTAAQAVLDRAKSLGNDQGLIFPSPKRGKRGTGLSDSTLSNIMRKTSFNGRVTAHGMRSSFRDFAADNDWPREIAESALAHAVPGIEGAYLRTEHLNKRRELMQAWADYLAR